MNPSLDITGYRYYDAEFGCAHAYLLPKVTELLDHYFAATHRPRRLFDLGCGSGAEPAHFARLGYHVVGVEPNPEGVAIANASFAELTTRTVDPLIIEEGSSDDDLVARFGTFPAVISLEVIEHVFSPRPFAKKVCDLLEPGGMALISTPYNGYLKNVAIALAGKFDRHVNPLWDYGHIKFWSIATLGQLLHETSFEHVRFHRVGRIPPLAKSLIAVAHRCSTPQAHPD